MIMITIMIMRYKRIRIKIQFRIKIDIENSWRRLCRNWRFRESESFSEYPAFKPRSKFNLKNKDVALPKLEDEIVKISVEGKKLVILLMEEKLVLANLKCDRSITIKEAEKASGVVM